VADLHSSNIAFSLPDLRGTQEAVVVGYLGPIRKQAVPANGKTSHPQYLVEPTSFAKYMLNMFEKNGAQFPWKIKIIDFGEGSSDFVISVHYWHAILELNSCNQPS
jgi:hypothetical protein